MFKMRTMVISMIVLLMACTVIEAQMTPAKRIKPKVIKGVSLNASVDDVWSLIAQPQLYANWVADLEQFNCNGNKEGAILRYTIPSDSKREQKLTYVSNQLRTIAYFITQSDYHHEEWVYRFIVGKDEDKSYLQFEAIFSTGSKNTDAKMTSLVEQEWKLIKQGLEKRFN